MCSRLAKPESCVQAGAPWWAGVEEGDPKETQGPHSDRQKQKVPTTVPAYVMAVWKATSHCNI